ncbi:MAG TPA: ABC transporter ATP-binding protein/permease [Candidatus Rikenella faecigallinarum]|uniref:ABC transporter ATP-binding protein/permease n=1 Tax=Candidatus Rikenella faecigallinarum TaxID=2838745 RepID=A0A9D1QCK9_9BACT|nr:ABC transporter ATP-binding protein/permease [Candidatus Rikenella faecigallinarum]
MNTYFRILRFGRPYGRYAIPYFVCIIFHTIFNTLMFSMLIPIIDIMFNADGMVETVTTAPEFALSSDYFKALLNYGLYRVAGAGYSVKDILVALAVVTVIIVLLSNTFRYFAQRILENLRIHTLQQIRDEMFDRVIRLQVGYFSNERKGDIISKITADVQVVQFCITSTFQVFFKEPFLLIGYFWLLISISFHLTLFTIAVLPVIALFIGYIVKRLRRSATEGQESFGEMVSLLDESLGAIKTVKGYNATGYIEQKFRNLDGRYSDIMRSIAKRQQLASPMSEFLGVASLSFILVYGGNMILGGELGAAEFITYLGAFSQVTRPARAIADAFGSINQGIAAGERVLEMMDTPPTITDKPEARTLTEFRDTIEFRHVRFAYEDKQVLNDVSFTIPKGQTVALVGPSGGGKSTISDLIPRFYDPAEGTVLIDGIDLRDYAVESVRAHMGIVAQETILFNDTIEENIRMGNNTATLEEVMEAARVANAYDFIMETENGFQTNIGDRGMKLSGGQRQRLSIARAVLRNPDILILDEATSALDTESERLVQESLSSLLKGRTSLVIAHRLSTIQHADKIIVVESGRIAEQGTHAELMAREGIYHKLIEMQQLAE